MEQVERFVLTTRDRPIIPSLMSDFARLCGLAFGLGMLGAALPLAAADTFTVATYNVENYLLETVGTRTPKPELSRKRVREAIRALDADVLALQEMGDTNALLELRASLKREGLDYPHWEHVRGWDTNIFVAVLSRLPITGRRPHTNENYLLNGRRFQVSRGFVEVDLRVNDRYGFTLMTTHLKSRRAVPDANEADMREQEAILLRAIVDARLQANPEVNLVLLGDLNDTKDSRSTRVVLGRGRTALVDTRPAERTGDTEPNPIARFEPRHVTWTHYYGKEDTYSRIDFILLSPGMAREWRSEGSYVLTLPNWGTASDHRPVVAAFSAADR